MIAPIVWILFETTGTIGTIQTVIWKPGLFLRYDDYGVQNKLNLKCCLLSFSSLAQKASFSDLNSFVLDFYFFHVHTACCIQLHEGIKKRAEGKFAFSGKHLIFLTGWSIFYGWQRWRRPVMSPTLVAILTFLNLLRIRYQVKTVDNGNFLRFERSWKNMYFQSNWLEHLLLMTSYLVTIEADHHWACLKMRASDTRTATENVRCWCFIL